MENQSVSQQNDHSPRAARARSPQIGVAGGAELPSDDRVAQAVAGDRQALEELLSALRPRLHAVAVRMMRDRDEAEDVVQDALIKACRHLHRYEGRAAFSTWLHRIVVNTALDRLRGAAARPGHATGTAAVSEPDERPAPEPVDSETPEALLGRAELAGVVHGALAGLSPAHREALTLRELEGESYRTIARLSRCPVGTVMSRLHHARRRLGEQLVGGAAELLAA